MTTTSQTKYPQIESTFSMYDGNQNCKLKLSLNVQRLFYSNGCLLKVWHPQWCSRHKLHEIKWLNFDFGFGTWTKVFNFQKAKFKFKHLQIWTLCLKYSFNKNTVRFIRLASRNDWSRLVPDTEIIMSMWWIMKRGSSCTWYGKYAKLSDRNSIWDRLVFWKWQKNKFSIIKNKQI